MRGKGKEGVEGVGGRRVRGEERGIVRKEDKRGGKGKSERRMMEGVEE